MPEQSHASVSTATNVSVRPLQEHELASADRIMRVAFGTFLGLPEPEAFMGDAAYVANRWETDPSAAFAAEVDGELAGSNFATNWGSFGFFGPLTIRPDLWDRGVAKRLMEPVMDCFDRWGTKQAGLFTFAHSPKHVHLYQRFGFWPGHLTAIMSKPVASQGAGASGWTRFSEIPGEQRERMLRACREVTDRISEGLDVTAEVRAVDQQRLGETVLLRDEEGELSGLAVCHSGPGTEAGSGTCYIKFAAVRPGRTAGEDFDRLLGACEAFAAGAGAARLAAGVNTARQQACQQMLAHGFRTDIQGVAMHRPNAPAHNRPDVHAIDDWR